jgi:hypothetical protein
MEEAAVVIEEVSALYGYSFPEHANWTAHGLRQEMPHVQADYPNPQGLYEVNCAGHAGWADE